MVLQLARQLARVGTREAAGQLRSAPAARQFEQRERIAARLRHDAVTDALVQRARHHARQQSARVLVVEPSELQLRKRGEIWACLAAGEHDRHRLGQQAPGDEPEHLTRGAVEPLHIVDDAQERALLRRAGQQAERRQRDQEAVRRVAGLETERDAQRRALVAGQRAEPVEHRGAEPVQARERQLHLGLHALDLREAEPGRLPGRVPQQRRLAHARFAPDREHGAAPGARAVQKPVQRIALAHPPAEARQRRRGHRARDGT